MCPHLLLAQAPSLAEERYPQLQAGHRGVFIFCLSFSLNSQWLDCKAQTTFPLGYFSIGGLIINVECLAQVLALSVPRNYIPLAMYVMCVFTSTATFPGCPPAPSLTQTWTLEGGLLSSKSECTTLLPKPSYGFPLPRGPSPDVPTSLTTSSSSGTLHLSRSPLCSPLPCSTPCPSHYHQHTLL